MRTQGFILVRIKMSLRPVDSADARVALHCNAHSRGLQAFERGSLSLFIGVRVLVLDQ
jgi:hypothetical protein